MIPTLGTERGIPMRIERHRRGQLAQRLDDMGMPPDIQNSNIIRLAQMRQIKQQSFLGLVPRDLNSDPSGEQVHKARTSSAVTAPRKASTGIPPLLHGLPDKGTSIFLFH